MGNTSAARAAYSVLQLLDSTLISGKDVKPLG